MTIVSGQKAVDRENPIGKLWTIGQIGGELRIFFFFDDLPDAGLCCEENFL